MHEDGAVRQLPATTDDLDELRALQGELVVLREEMRRTGGDPARLVPYPSGWVMLGGGSLGAVAFYGLVAAAYSVVGEGGWGWLAAGLSVAVPSTVGCVRLYRSRMAPLDRLRAGRQREAKQFHLAVLARNAVLWERLRPQPAPDLPLPPDRQPTHFATRMHARRGGGADPEVALRALPPDASRVKVWYLRHLGRGGVVTLLLCAVILLGGGLVIALDVRASELG